MNQIYLIVENNIVVNSILWDGSDLWIPPEGVTILPMETTPCYDWVFDEVSLSYFLKEFNGIGAIGWTWDGTHLTTNAPVPANP